MPSKISPRRITLLITLIGVAFSLSFIFYFNHQNKIYSAQLLITQREQSDSSLPAHLKIPSINLNSTIEQVGLNSKGEMDTPKNIINVAWFKLGPSPGQKGSAVIDGHYGWKDGKPAAFDNLYKLRRGDKIYVENDKGLVISFVVREIRNYDPGANARDIFLSKDGGSHLNLITCGGVWNKLEKSYSNRLVIFTDKVN